MDVKQLISELNNFDTDAVVVVGDICGWSNIESVAEDGSCVKILMSDNVVFSDDRAAKNAEPPAIPQQPQGKICPSCKGTGMEKWPSGAVSTCGGSCKGTGRLSPVR